MFGRIGWRKSGRGGTEYGARTMDMFIHLILRALRSIIYMHGI